jgi:hypothetical protein
MITDIEDMYKIKVGYYIVSVGKIVRSPTFKLRKISKIKKIRGCIIFDTFLEDESVGNLFAYKHVNDYVCETYQEVLDNFSEFMI